MFISTTPHSLRLRTTTSHHPLMKHPIRKLLNEYASRNTISPSPLPSTLLRKPITSFDTSMILTILFIVTALLFLGFFSVFIGRFSGQNSIQNSRRRRLQRSSPSRPTQQVLEPPTTTVGSLPVFAYDGLNAKKHTDCPVCLGEFQEKELVKLIPYCGHVFHSQCIDTWLSSHVSCPLCRTTQFFRSPSTKKKDNPCLSVLEELESESREV